MTKTNHDPNSSAANASKQAPKPGLEVKPVTDLEPEKEQGDKVRGGGGGWGPQKIFSDASLKSQVEPISDALAKLRELRF